MFFVENFFFLQRNKKWRLCAVPKRFAVLFVCAWGPVMPLIKKERMCCFVLSFFCTVGGVTLWSLAESTDCKYDHFEIPFTVLWLTWLHTITHILNIFEIFWMFWTQCISPFMHGSTILSPGSKCCCVHLALMLSCIFDFVAHWMGEKSKSWKT